jgi:hypothetical protein
LSPVNPLAGSVAAGLNSSAHFTEEQALRIKKHWIELSQFENGEFTVQVVQLLNVNPLSQRVTHG